MSVPVRFFLAGARIACGMAHGGLDKPLRNPYKGCWMFFVDDSREGREARIASFLIDADAAIAVLLAAAHFEWVTGRAIMALGNSPNKLLRPKLLNCHGPDKYKDL